MRKTNKASLLTELETEVDVQPRLPAPTVTPTAYITDGMAAIQAVGTGSATYFGDLAILHYNMLKAHLGQHCIRVDVVFDQYKKMSIKEGERERRGQESAVEVKIQGPATPTPQQWKKFIANPKNKSNLSAYLTKSLCELGMSQLRPGQKMILGGGCEDGQRAVMVTNNKLEDLECLYSDHEEADTRLLLHVQHAARECKRIVVHSPDTDVAVLCTSFCSELDCDELWFRTGVKDNARYIPIHSLSRSLGPQVCKALPAFHAITGCDSTGSFFGIGKKKAWSILSQDPEHQSNLANFGNEPEMGEECFRNSENFVCDLYEAGKAQCTADNMRYHIFCQKKQRNEALRPTSDSLRLHLQRSNYQTCLWRRALEPMQKMPPPDGHGWEEKGSVLAPVLMTKDPAPKSLVELVSCGCNTSCRRGNCSCRVHDLACTEACRCMGDDDCQNPNKLTGAEVVH